MAKIYQAASMGEAHVRVARVDDPGQADLLVYRVGSQGMAHGDEYWFITYNKQDANTWVYFTSPGFAQLKICFVKHRGEAGWQRPSRFAGRFK